MELVLRSNWHYCPKFSSISFFIAPTKWTLLLARCFSDFSFACDHFLPNPKYHAIRYWRFGALRCAFFFPSISFLYFRNQICWFWRLIRDFALFYLHFAITLNCTLLFSKRKEFSFFGFWLLIIWMDRNELNGLNDLNLFIMLSVCLKNL